MEISGGSQEQDRGSVPAALIRLIQAEAGLESCYATAAAMSCVRTNCCWRSGCYRESEGGLSAGNGSMDLDRGKGVAIMQEKNAACPGGLNGNRSRFSALDAGAESLRVSEKRAGI